MLVSSPRTWGCFCAGRPCLSQGQVFPTHVGVFLDVARVERCAVCLPHARGGVSTCGTTSWSASASSPRTWGCFQTGVIHDTKQIVFPTHVGVFLPRPREFEQILRLPHARGGVSEEMIAIDRKAMSSPRTWGCFRCAVFGDAKIPVFPTHVGVFLYSKVKRA